VPRLGDSLQCLTLGASPGARGASVFVPRDTPGPGTPLFLAPGLGLDGRCFEPFAPLAADRRLVFWNLPNVLPEHGGTAALGRLYLDHADRAGMPRRFVFGGSSLGGTIALAAALEAPERCAGLVLAGASSAWSDLGLFMRMGPHIHRFLVSRTYHLRFAEVLFPTLPGQSPTVDALRAQAEHRTKAHVGAVIRLLREDGGFDMRERLVDVKAPVLVLHDPRDGTVPFAAGRRFAAIGGARLVEVQDGGHLPFFGNLEVCMTALRAFLAEVDARESR
jgi:pimeloyl-ACP methyl ester carboxylesterase